MLMTTILHLDASARLNRSISRDLSNTFVDAWLAERPCDVVMRRDLALDPPPHVTEAWIAAAFTPPAERTPSMQETLRWSDAAIAEIEAADLLVIGTPMYNYGMPSALKAWFDQAIRVGRTFSFDLARGDWPLEPLLSGKHMVVLSARGEFGFAPGGVRFGSNNLDPHIATCGRYLGVSDDAVEIIAVEYQEFGDERHRQSLASAADRAKDRAKILAAAQPH